MRWAWAAWLLCACSSGPKAPSDGGAWDGRCEVEIAYRETGAAPSVFVAGEWNGFAPARDELRDDGSGLYRIRLRLPPGLYGYKLVVQGDGREPWRLDPSNPYRVYVDGVENSGLRVPDCSRPALVVETVDVRRPEAGAGRVEARLLYAARSAGPLESARGEIRSGRAVRALTAEELRAQGTQIAVRVTGLADGKHTVRLWATDRAGRDSEPVWLGFWIEPEPFDWRDALIYLVFTDRFRDGDPSNNPPPTGASRGADWHGGDLAGVTAALREGYFDELGVRALWLTPFNVNPEGTYTDSDEIHRISGYHGYWPIEPLEVDRRLGGAEALAELVEAAHARGIRVLMDLVLNHVHELHPYVSAHPDWFNDGCLCGTSGCDWTARRLDCLFRPYLPDVDWTHKEASERFIADALAWMERFDLDGFRVDAVKHVVDGAVFNLGTRVREAFEKAGTPVFLLGETAMGWDPGAGPDEGGNVENYGTISRYVGPAGLSGQLDFVLYYAAALQFLRDAPGRGMRHVDFWTRASMRKYPPGSVMTPYIGSHDTPRFITLASHPELAGNKWENLPPPPDSDEPYDRMYVALAWLLALPGAPLLYQGDEYGEYGGADPDNRHPLRTGSQLTARERRLLDRVRRLGRARKRLRGLRRGSYRPLHVTETLWAVARGEGDDLVIAIVNRSGSSASVAIPVPAEVAPAGRTFEDELGSATRVTVTRGAIDVALPPWSALYLR